MPIFKKTIIYAIQDVISLNCLFNYIFFTKLFFAFPKIRNAMLDFFKQVLPVGIAEVIFLPHLAKTTKKQKESPHSFFTNVSSLFFDTKKEHLNDLDTLNLYFF